MKGEKNFVIHPLRLSNDSFRLVEQVKYSKAFTLKTFIHMISKHCTLLHTAGKDSITLIHKYILFRT